MSSLFNDPEYTRMSTDESAWLELAIEPFKFPLNDLLGQLPEKIEITFKDIEAPLCKRNPSINIDSNGFEMSIDSLVKKKITSALKEKFTDLSFYERRIIEEAYEIENKKPIQINFKTQTMSAPIVVKKQYSSIKDDKILDTCADIYVSSYLKFNGGWSKSEEHGMRTRFNEILDILAITGKIRSTRSIEVKLRRLKGEIKMLIKDNTWNIKNAELFKGLCVNISQYIQYGNMHALMNFTRLKCMTHKGAPIYSMEEIK